MRLIAGLRKSTVRFPWLDLNQHLRLRKQGCASSRLYTSSSLYHWATRAKIDFHHPLAGQIGFAPMTFLLIRQVLYSWATTREATLLRKVWLNRDKVPGHRRSIPKRCHLHHFGMIPPALTLFLSRTESRLSFCEVCWNRTNAYCFGDSRSATELSHRKATLFFGKFRRIPSDDIVTMESSEHHMERNFIILSCGDWIWTNDLLVMSRLWTRRAASALLRKVRFFWKALKPLKGNRNDNMSLNPCVRIWTVIDDYHHLRYPFQLPFTLLSQGIILFSPDKGRCKPYQTGLPNSRFRQALFSELESNQHLVTALTMVLYYIGSLLSMSFKEYLRDIFYTGKASLQNRLKKIIDQWS